MRGNRHTCYRCRLERRSIPARAGEPPPPWRWYSVYTVYPRACGGTCRSGRRWRRRYGLSPRVRGNPKSPNTAASTAGLSPRVRGNLRRDAPENAEPWSIPARAGEPPRRVGGGHRSTVYPRACGGTVSLGAHDNPATGLSPRVRGNLFLAPTTMSEGRSIPARAGEPMSVQVAPASCTVYPRACGGTSDCSGDGSRWEGLSPRVRGNPMRSPSSLTRVRSIPARAGEPSRRRGLRRPSKVYPRACGGTANSAQRTASDIGLSPRVRGNHRWGMAWRGQSRSIPARAGEPETWDSIPAIASVYPRACGGTPGRLEQGKHTPGLSPRVRGNPDRRLVHYQRGRSIPARAGEPPPTKQTTR